MKTFGNACFLVACGIGYSATRHPALAVVAVGLLVIWGVCTYSGPKN